MLDDTDVPNVDSATAGVGPMPIAVGEVEVVGGPAVTYDGTRTETVGCAAGPPVTIDGVVHGTSLTFSADDLVSGATVRAEVCGEVTLPAGESLVTMPATFQWQPRALAGVDVRRPARRDGCRGDVDPGVGPAPVGADVLDGLAHGRTVIALDLAPGRGRADAGARAAGGIRVAGEHRRRAARPGHRRRLDAQGWVLPPGSREVTVRYSPGVRRRAARRWRRSAAGWP